MFVYRQLGFRQFVRGIINCAAGSGMILFILAAASSFSWVLTVAQLPQRLVELMAGTHGSHTLFMLASILLLIVAGAILEGLPSLIVLAPILMPIASKVGVSELHYGIVLIIAMGIGAFMPPVSVGYYVTCAVCQTTIEKSGREMIPFIAILIVGLLVVALVPWFTLYLPAKFHLAG
jgi:TRAP-type C4-dicarboxylate transport system permease large subunit